MFGNNTTEEADPSHQDKRRRSSKDSLSPRSFFSACFGIGCMPGHAAIDERASKCSENIINIIIKVNDHDLTRRLSRSIERPGGRCRKKTLYFATTKHIITIKYSWSNV